MKKKKLILAAAVLATAGIMTGCNVSDAGGGSENNVTVNNENDKDPNATGTSGDTLNKQTDAEVTPTTAEIMDDWQKRMDQIRYTETDSEGKTFSIFAYYTNESCSVHVTEDDGSKKQYYIDSKLLYDLKSFDDSESLTTWNRKGPDTPESDKDIQIRVECRIVNRDYKFGTNHMPDENGIEKLHSIRDMILEAVGEDSEIKPFTVEIGGKEYNTVSGTGNIVGTGAIIDFGEDKWWQVMGYVGRYELTDIAKNLLDDNGIEYSKRYSNAFIEINEDGSLHLVVNDIDLSGSVDPEVGYAVWATGLNHELGMIFEDSDAENPEMLHIMMREEPKPGQFEGFNVVLQRVK